MTDRTALTPTPRSDDAEPRRRPSHPIPPNADFAARVLPLLRDDQGDGSTLQTLVDFARTRITAAGADPVLVGAVLVRDVLDHELNADIS